MMNEAAQVRYCFGEIKYTNEDLRSSITNTLRMVRVSRTLHPSSCAPFISFAEMGDKELEMSNTQQSATQSCQFVAFLIMLVTNSA